MTRVKEKVNVVSHNTSIPALIKLVHLVTSHCFPNPGNVTYNVHDGEDIVLHGFAPMILHHFRVSHHQRFHPLLLADGALAKSPLFSPLAVLPSFSLSLNVSKALMGI